ncbi:MAG: riiboflavin synthase alpha chain [Candidatus Nanosalina sp. J07AB43]|nr:MAG: riiboflavin synthase alpha chain [Candidatus Nanosalina sp. J07AB43]
MFTGIIEETVQVDDVENAGEGKRIRIQRPDSFKEISCGESICLCGACLTVESFDSSQMKFFLAEETLEKTWFSTISEGDKINLERSLKAEDRMSGHIVQGHVEQTTEVLEG